MVHLLVTEAFYESSMCSFRAQRKTISEPSSHPGTALAGQRRYQCGSFRLTEYANAKKWASPLAESLRAG